MKKNNWPKKLLIVLTSLIAISLFFVLTYSSVMKKNNNDKPLLSESINNEMSDSKHSNTIDLQSDSIESNTNCIKFIEYLDSPSYYEYDRWQQDLGIPTVNYSTSGEPILEDHPFSVYTAEALEVMSNESPIAGYVLGQKMIWESLTGSQKHPSIYKVNNYSGDFLETYDPVTLEKGREYLFMSAVKGHLYSFIAIANSYAFELDVTKEQLTDEEVKDMQLKIITYGNMMEHLIPELHSRFFNSDLEQNFSNEIKEKSMANLLNKFIQSRYEIGLGEYIYPAKPDIESISKNICKGQ